MACLQVIGDQLLGFVSDLKCKDGLSRFEWFSACIDFLAFGEERRFRCSKSAYMEAADKCPRQERHNKLFLGQAFSNIILYSSHGALSVISKEVFKLIPARQVASARETEMPLYRRASVDGGISYNFAASA